MNSIQLIKKVNNTELGGTACHETYIHIPQGLDISDLIQEKEVIIECINKKTGKKYDIRKQVGREVRIVGLGPFYRDNEVSAGDEILIEKYYDGETSYYIDVNKKENIIMISPFKEGFEVLNEERLNLLNQETTIVGTNDTIKIEYINEYKKRKDSPIKTKAFSVMIGEKNLVDNYNKQELIEIEVDTEKNTAVLNKASQWKKYYLELED